MIVQNIYFSVAVPIIPDYLYTSDHKEYVQTSPLYSESNDNKFSNKELAAIKSSTLNQCLDNYVPSDISPTVKTARQSNIHKVEEIETRNKKVFLNMELEDHGQQIQLGSQLKDLNKGKEHTDIKNNHQSADGHDYLFGSQYTQYRKKKMSRSYKREDKDKYASVVPYSSSDKRALSNREFEKVCALLLYQKRKSALVNALMRGHKSLQKENRRKRRQTEQTNIKFQEKLDNMKNYIARKLLHTRPKGVKSLMVPEFLHTQDMSVFHNITSEDQNNTGRHFVRHDQNANERSDRGLIHRQQTALSNCNIRYSTLYCEPQQLTTNNTRSTCEPV
jgi:hypothetical protein